MPAHFTIRITKAILAESKTCGTQHDAGIIGENCAIAMALKDLFPAVMVTCSEIYPYGISGEVRHLKIPLPKIALDFINVFDSLRPIHNVRDLLPEFEFEIPIPDEVISRINIEELRTIAEKNRPASAVAGNEVRPLVRN